MSMAQTPNQFMELHEPIPEKGIVNIGSHPENDIVVQDSRVMPFHMMLDLRQSPYHVIGLSPDADIQVDGIPLRDGEARDVMDLSQVRFCGYTLNLMPVNGGHAGSKIAVIPPAFSTPAASSEPKEDGNGSSAAHSAATPAVAMLQVPTSDVILVETQEKKFIIDVEQTAVYPITIINGGAIVASFEVQVEGVPAEWVKITPERVNLNEGGRAGLEVQITPPRSSDSRAGVYPVLIKVGSANYPGQYGGVRVELTVNPYYEFAIGNLTPRYKSVSWHKKSANTHFPITNQGNAPANYLVMAQDDENGCQFEFEMQDEVSLVKQAEVAVKPGETRNIPIRITPLKRNLVRLRARQYQYSLTTQSMSESATSRIVSGTFVSRPLFGIFSILLAAIILLVGGFFILRPRITEFNVAEDVIALGDPAIMNWKVSPFTTSLRIEGVSTEISGSQGQIEVVPTSTASTYTFVAGNWLSRLLRMEDVRSNPITVLAIPPSPEITTFFVDKTRIFEGDDVTVKWSVTDAEEVFLTVDGVRGALKPEEFNGERTVTLRNNSLIVLEAKNASGSKFRSEFIHAQKPSIVIDEFSLSKTQITKGDPVTIQWKVSGTGVENVKIAPFTDVYPLQGELTFFPEASMEFVLTVKNRDLEEIRLLPIGVLEPGAEPAPPTVEFFKAAPEEIVGSGSVDFSWSVSGVFDRIEITNLEGVVASGMPAQGFKALNVDKTTSYVLTAYNGALSSAAILDVKVSDTKKNVIVEIDKIVPSTSIYRGDSVTVYYNITAAKNDNTPVDLYALGWPEISGSVVATDGYDTCTPVDLPVHACVLTLNTSESNKQITATYSGDDNYVRRTSDPYPVGLDVVGATPKFSSFAYSLSTVVVGQQTMVSFQIEPEDSAATIPISGKVEVVEGDTTLCSSVLTAVVGDETAAKGECLVSFSTSGSKFLTLKYAGNDIYDGKIASMPPLTVKQASTQTTLTANWSTITVVGEAIDINFFVSALAPGAGIPTGQVVIKDKNNPADKCTGTLDASGMGHCSLILNHTGILEIVASYSGDGNFLLSDTSTYLHAVEMASTTTEFTSFSPSSTTVGQEVLVKFKVSVVSPGSGSPTGNVIVDAGSGDTCTGTINAFGQGQCAVLLTQSGTRSFKGIYAGDTLYKTSSAFGYSYPVASASTKTAIISHSPSPSAKDEAVEIKFTVDLSLPSSIKPNGPAIVVTSTGETCISTVSDGAGSCKITFPTEGRRIINVRFLGNGNFAASTSPDVSHVVKKATSTSILSAVPAPSTVDQPVSIQFSVFAVTGGGDPPSGSVTVTSDTGETCAGSISMGNGSCSITFTSAGSKNLTATYNGDSDYKTSTSLPYLVNVVKGTTTTKITNDLSTATQVGENVNVEFQVTSNISAKPTGSVTVSVVGSVDPRETCTGTLSNGIGSCTLTLIQAGSVRFIQAVYAGTSDRFASSTSPNVSHPVDPANTIIEVIDNSPETSVVGQSVSFKVRVRAATLSTLRPAGSFTVMLADNTSLCSGVLDAVSSEGSCIYKFTNPGIQSIKAVYSGAPDYAGSISAVTTHNVSLSATKINMTINPAPSVLNQAVTVNVSVAPDGLGSGTPTGSVSVTATKGGSTKTCSIAALSFGSGSCSISLDAVGDWTVTAAYNGDSNFNSCLSGDVIQTVGKVASTTTVSTTPSPSVKGQAVTFNVAVAKSGPGSGILGKTVTVTAVKGSITKTCTTPDIGTTGISSCIISLDSVGEWIVSAAYSGNDDFKISVSPEISHVVNQIPTATTITTNPSPSSAGQTITVNVDVSKSGAGTGIPTGTVSVTAVRAGGGTASCADITLSSTDSGKGSCSLKLSLAGTWTISAIYSGSLDFISSSGSTNQAVIQANTATSLTLSSTTPVVGENIMVSVSSVTAVSPGSGSPTGTVTVKATKTGSSPAVVVFCSKAIDLSETSKSCTLVLPEAVNWTISGVYSGDSNFLGSTDQESITVSKADTELDITGHTDEILFSNNVVVTFDLSASSPGSGTPSGVVTVTATAKISGFDYSKTCSGTSQCTLSLSPSGTWKLIASYPGDTNFKASTSSEVSHTVN